MQRTLLPLPLLVALSGLTACVPFQEQALKPATTAKDFTSRNLDDKGLQSFLATQKAAHGSWTPDRLALVGTYFHADIAVAKAEQQEAAARITTAGQRPNPVLSFSPGYNSTTSGISPWIVTPTLDVPIETAGKRSIRIDQARAEVEASRLRLDATAWKIRKEIRTSMLDLYAARQIGKQLKIAGQLHQDELKKLEIMVEAGESAAFELNQARLSLNQAQLAQHDGEKLQATALAQLASAVGVPSVALDPEKLDFSIFKTLPPDPGKLAQRQALRTRADLLAALADYAASDAALRLEIARQYPNLHLNPGYELDQTDNKWSLGFSLELPILNQNRGPIAEAEAKRKKVAKVFEAKQRAVFAEIEIALAAYRTSRAKVATASRLAKEAAHASDTTQSMVESGELAPLELTRRRIETSATTLGLEKALMEAQQAAGDLEAAVQIPARNSKPPLPTE